MEQTDDAELLRRYAESNSEAAFTELVRRHLNLVYRSALRQSRGNTHLAEDVTQAVFTQLARRAGSLCRHPRLVGWLYTTTHFVASGLLRTERRRQRREQEAHVIQDEGPLPASADGWEEVGPVLDQVMRGLGRVDREAILLHFFERRTFAEVGARLDLREDAARMRVARALEKLRTALARHGIRSTTAALGLMLATESSVAAPAGLVTSTTAAAVTAAGTVTPATSLILLMSTSKLALGLVALLAILAAGSAFHYQRQLQAAGTSLTVWDQRMTAAQSRLAAFRQTPSSAPVATAPKPDQRAGAPGASPAPTGDDIAKELELQRLQDLNSAASFILKTGGFLRSLGLTPVQIQQLEDSLLKELSGLDDLEVVNRLAGTELKSDPGLPAITQKLTTEMMKDAGAIMGPANLQALISYLQNQNIPADPNGPNRLQLGEASYVATQVAGLVFASATPLTTEQRAQMVQLIASNTPRYQPGDNNGMDTVNWEGVLAQGGSTLPPAQLNALRSLQASVAQDTLEKQVREAATKAAP
jgi:RNA polymerase sigma factor (sigma-70 family)